LSRLDLRRIAERVLRIDDLPGLLDDLLAIHRVHAERGTR